MNATSTKSAAEPTVGTSTDGGDEPVIRVLYLSKPALLAVLFASIVLILTCGVFSHLVARQRRSRRAQQETGIITFNGALGPAIRPARSMQGLTRAVLDTFPTFVWSSRAFTSPKDEDEESKGKKGDTEEAMELKELAIPNEKGIQTGSEVAVKTFSSAEDFKRCVCGAAEAPTGLDGASCLECSSESSRDNAIGLLQTQEKTRATDDTESEEMTPGRHLANHILCPICTEDFVEGELLRVLPCTGRHHYHATCIDEWLQARSSCPLCRMDFAPIKNKDRTVFPLEHIEGLPSPSEIPTFENEEAERRWWADAFRAQGYTSPGGLSTTPQTTGQSRPSTSTTSSRYAAIFEEYRSRHRRLRTLGAIRPSSSSSNTPTMRPGRATARSEDTDRSRSWTPHNSSTVDRVVSFFVGPMLSERGGPSSEDGTRVSPSEHMLLPVIF